MRVVQLWRFPVKSMPGESVDQVDVDERGIVGDRRLALRDRSTGLVLTARRVPELLQAATLPSRSDDELSAWLGRPVELIDANAELRGTYENPRDAFGETDWVSWQGPLGTFHDSGRSQVSLVSMATLRDWDVRRFRINIIVDSINISVDSVDGVDGLDESEDALVGRRLRIGGVELDVAKQIDRCVMVTRPQVGGVERDLGVLRTINAERAGNLGIGCGVVRTGRIAVGDEVQVMQ